MQGNRGHQGGARPNTVTSAGVPGGDDPSKVTHSSLEVNAGNSGISGHNGANGEDPDDADDAAGEEVEVPLCSTHTRYVRPRAALNSNLEWR